MRFCQAVTPRGTRRIGATIATLAWASGAALLLSAQSAPLTLVSTAWPPFTNAPGQPRFALDLVEAALGRIGVSARTAIVSAAEFTPALLGDRFDGSAAAWKDPDREQVLVFSQPYLENRLVLVGRHGSDVSAKSMADLRGKRVAIVEGYSYGDALDGVGPAFVRFGSEEDGLSRLLKGDVEYTLMDELVIQYIVSNYPQESGTRLAIGTTPLVRRELYLAIRRTRPDATAIVAGFNAQLRGMIADGTYHRLLHVDWIRADINDDGIPEYVPRSDRPGAAEPQRVYTLFSTPSTTVSEPEIKPGFYVGGNIYSDWASVPENYKAGNTQQPDPRRSTASIFKFTW
jgi:polar amino acid transport system substrate-binding protein